MLAVKQLQGPLAEGQMSSHSQVLTTQASTWYARHKQMHKPEMIKYVLVCKKLRLMHMSAGAGHLHLWRHPPGRRGL